MVKKFLNMFKKKGYERLPFLDFFGGSTRVDFELMKLALKDWTYTCMTKRADAISSMNWYGVKKLNDGTIQSLPNDHWLNLALLNPNAYMSLSEMLNLTTQWLDINGNMFWLKLYNEQRNQIIGFMPLIPAGIRIEIQANTLVGYNINGKYYDKNEVIHFKHLVPSIDTNNLIIGTSLVERAIDSITSNAEMNKFLKSYFENEGLPPLIGYIKEDFEMTEIQKESFKSQWRNRLPKNQITMIVDDRLRIEPLNTSNVFSNSNITSSIDSINKENIASIFGIPKGLITGDMQNRSTSETNQSTFFNNTVNPLAKKIMETFNNSIRNTENVEIMCDLHTDSNKEFELTALQFGLLQGAISIDEYREFLGYEKQELQEIQLPTTTLSLKKKV